MLDHHKLCPCTSRERPLGERVKSFTQEFTELTKVSTWKDFKDELSDCCWALSDIFGVKFPFEEIHLEKVTKRVETDGCARSHNHQRCGGW